MIEGRDRTEKQRERERERERKREREREGGGRGKRRGRKGSPETKVANLVASAIVQSGYYSTLLILVGKQ